LTGNLRATKPAIMVRPTKPVAPITATVRPWEEGDMMGCSVESCGALRVLSLALCLGL